MSAPTPKADVALRFAFITLFLDVVGGTIVVPIAPRLIGSYVSDPETQSRAFGAFVATYAFMVFLSSPALGAISDKVGRRPVILLSLVGSAADYLFMALAPSLGLLFVGRAISGLTGGNAGPIAAYVADVTPVEKRAQAFGTMGMVFGLGLISGPLIGGFFGDLGERLGIGIRLPFFVAAGLTAANAIFGALVLPESLHKRHRKPLSLSRLNPLSSIPTLRKYPAVFDLACAIFFRQSAEYGFHATWVLYTTYKLGWSIRENAISLAAHGVVLAIVQGVVLRRLLPVWGPQKATLVGYGCTAVGYFLYGIATSGWMLYATILATGLGDLSGPSTNTLITRHVPANDQGSVQGAIASLGGLTTILGPAVATWVFGYFISARAPARVPGAPFFLGSLLLAVGFGILWRSFRQHQLPNDAKGTN